MKQLIGMILSCIILIILMAWWSRSAFHIQQNKLCSESSLIFADVVQIEKAMQIGRQTGRYDSESSPNEIPGAEKEEWCNQDLLFYRDSTRSVLDSLFRATLLEHKIQAKTSIRCVWAGHVINTTSDSLFYKDAIPLKQFTYRIDENPDSDITLQAYIKFSFGTVWRHSYLLWMILGLGLVLLGAIIGGYYLWSRKMKRLKEEEFQLQQQKQQQEQERQALLQQHELQQKELQKERQLLEEKQARLPRALIQNKTIKWVELSKDLFFDKEHGELCYKNEVNIRLKENSSKLFICFIKYEKHKLTSEKICIEVLGRSVKNKLSKSDRDAVASTIHHLRGQLCQLPFIKIETIRGNGYQMFFSSPEDSAEAITE